MILTNIDTVPGKKIVELFGIVQGSTVRARHDGADIAAGLKNMAMLPALPIFFKEYIKRRVFRGF